jgi:hypothetical protein
VAGAATVAAAVFAMATTALDTGFSVANTASSFGVKGAAAIASGAARATMEQHSTSRCTMKELRAAGVWCGSSVLRRWSV